MLINLKNIQKTYNTKTGVSFRAISNVSLSFDESGMVFLLGKSGSGKTTLLNLIGGMDSIDSGSIYIGGKNLARLSIAEVDSYRNTMVGFVFQEFNLIDYMTVYENVRLALDMQSDKDDSKVELALKQVDLLEKKHEKVKNLSGGQRQRVGIARSIVKNPDIILADEPTGALDSATGEEVMRIFERLAKEKLVIVVSHDAEKAITYADRIVEMKDGTIYRDIRRKKEGEKIDYSQIHITSNTLIRLEKGVTLKDSDVDQINEILNQKGRKAYINVDTNPQKIKAMFPNLREAVDSGDDSKTTQSIKNKSGESLGIDGKNAANNTNPNDPQNATNNASLSDNKSAISTANPAQNGTNVNAQKASDNSELVVNKDSFVPYKPSDSEVKKVDFKKSYLPTSKALKIGLKNLKLKIPKMVITIIIAVIAFALFASAVSFQGYNLTAAYTKTIKKSDYKYIMATNAAGTRYRITDTQIAKLKQNNPQIGVYSQYNSEFYGLDMYNTPSSFYFNSFIEADDAANLKLEMLVGESELKDYQSIVISQAAAREYIRYSTLESVKDYGDLIGKEIRLFRHGNSAFYGYKVVGVFACDMTKYNDDIDHTIIYEDIQNFIEGVLIVKAGFRENFSLQNIANAGFTTEIYHTSYGKSGHYSVYSNNSVFCKDNNIGIDYDTEKYENQLIYEDEDGGRHYAFNPLDYQNFALNDNEIFVSSNFLYWNDIYVPGDISRADSITVAEFNADPNRSLMVFDPNNQTPYYYMTNFTIKGIIREGAVDIIVSENLLKQGAIEQMYTHKVLLALSGDNKIDTALISFLHDNDYSVESDFAYSYSTLLGFVSDLSEVIIAFALLLCLLVVILLFTFISSSIKLTRKQIGILRAMGARRIDTFKIYALEGIVIGVLSFAIAVTLLLIFAPIINALVSASLGYYLSVLTIGIKDILSVLILMLAVTAISILIPIRKFNKITPIKAIVEKE